MHTAMKRLVQILLTAVVIHVFLTAVILVHQHVLTWMTAVVLGVDLLDIGLRCRAMVILLGVLVGVQILVLNALDVVEYILVVLRTQ